MLTLICQMRLPDGQTITGKVDARFPGIAYDFTYTGNHDSLGDCPPRGTVSDLELFFRVKAGKCGAAIQFEKTGEYEFRADTAAA